MTIEVHSGHESAAARAADLVTAALTDGARVLALPTGRTMVAVYDALVARPIEWPRMASFNLDEFVGLAPSHPGSFRAYMEAHLFRRVGLPAAAIGFLRGDVADPSAECARYEAAIADAGGLDLALLGLGANGHIGFNEPGDELRAETHLVSLHRATRTANADRFGDDWRRVPAQALTLGMGRLLQARQVIVVATGTTKAAAVTAACTGPLTTSCPASWLQVHPDVTVVVDTSAATGLHEAPSSIRYRLEWRGVPR